MSKDVSRYMPFKALIDMYLVMEKEKKNNNNTKKGWRNLFLCCDQKKKNQNIIRKLKKIKK